MLATSIVVLLAALAALRFPEIPVLAILPAVIAVGLAATLPKDRGAWVAGLLAGALLFRLPSSGWLALATALLPLLAWYVRGYVALHPVVVTGFFLVVTAYVAAATGSGSFTLPLEHLLDLCVALVIGATLSALAYAPTQRERLGPRGRTGFRIR